LQITAPINIIETIQYPAFIKIYFQLLLSNKAFTATIGKAMVKPPIKP
jgi:hypothetical protein